MDKYCKEALKYFEKCLKHFENWNDIHVKLENSLEKHNATSDELKRSAMQSSMITQNCANDHTKSLIVQISRECKALKREVSNLELTIKELQNLKAKIIKVPLHTMDYLDGMILKLFEELHSSATTLSILLAECLRNVEIKNLRSFDNIREATKIISNSVEGFEKNLINLEDAIG